MISVPADYTEPLATIFGYSSPVMAVWEPGLVQYVVTPTAPADSLVAGQGYWIRFPAIETITTAGTAPVSPFTIPLAQGWNMVGCPQSTPITIASLTVTNSANTTQTFVSAAASGVVGNVLYTYQSGDTSYEVISDATGSLIPYDGYWLYASQPCTLTIPAAVGG